MKVHKNNPSWMVSGMAMVLLCTLLFSCNNEDYLKSGDSEKACDNICFGISSDKNVQTRGYACSDDEGYTAGRFMLSVPLFRKASTCLASRANRS